MYIVILILAFLTCWFGIDWIEDNVKSKINQILISIVVILIYVVILNLINDMQDRDEIREALLNDNCVTTNQIVDRPIIEKIGNEYIITDKTEQLFEYKCNSRNQYLKSPNLEL